nr:MAG TPA: hypothetical protein [Caudoviricetes sp.]
MGCYVLRNAVICVLPKGKTPNGKTKNTLRRKPK